MLSVELVSEWVEALPSSQMIPPPPDNGGPLRAPTKVIKACSAATNANLTGNQLQRKSDESEEAAEPTSQMQTDLKKALSLLALRHPGVPRS